MKSKDLQVLFAEYCKVYNLTIERSGFNKDRTKYITAQKGTVYLDQSDPRAGNNWAIIKNEGEGGTICIIYGYTNSDHMASYLSAKIQEANSRLLIAVEDSGTVMFAVLDNGNFEGALKQALTEHYDTSIEILSISEPDKMMERTVKVNVPTDIEDGFTATVTLTPAYLYK